MKITVSAEQLDPARTFLCGQCFRWKETADGGFSGIAHGRRLTVKREGGNVVIGEFPENEEALWRDYFHLSADYGEYIRRLSSDAVLKRACESSAGIRVLRQEPFETLISFIISQNNNIPRISGIVERLCESFGEKLDGGFSFPSAKRLEGVTEGDLAGLRAGFRARYIVDAVNKVNSGEVDLAGIDALPLDEARERLKTIVGVGDKVADCVLLFAYRRLSAFPKDVWVKRIMSELYPDGLPACTEGIEGIAQQYLFDHVRNHNGLVAQR